MLLRIQDKIINTEKICFIDINKKMNYVEVYFSREKNLKIQFDDWYDLDRFLSEINVKDF